MHHYYELEQVLYLYLNLLKHLSGQLSQGIMFSLSPFDLSPTSATVSTALCTLWTQTPRAARTALTLIKTGFGEFSPQTVWVLQEGPYSLTVWADTTTRPSPPASWTSQTLVL